MPVIRNPAQRALDNYLRLSQAAWSDELPRLALQRSRCPRANPKLLVPDWRGGLRPKECRRLLCPECARVLRARRVWASELAAPDRTFLFTQVPVDENDSPYRAALKFMSDVRRSLKRWTPDAGEWWWVLERNPRGTGYHIHALHRGPVVPQRLLQRAARAAGGGRAGSRDLHEPVVAYIWYLTKGIVRSPTEFSRLHGGQIGRWSRGWHLIDGSVRTVRCAEALALSRHEFPTGDDAASDDPADSTGAIDTPAYRRSEVRAGRRTSLTLAIGASRSFTSIAEEQGISRSTVVRTARELGIRGRPGRPARLLPDELAAEARRMHASGHGLHSIAQSLSSEDYRVSWSQVRRAVSSATRASTDPR